jgi:IS5 family transposase
VESPGAFYARQAPSRNGFCLQKAHIGAKVENMFREIKRQFGFQNTRLRGMLKNSCKVNVLAALANLFMARHLLLCKT